MRDLSVLDQLIIGRVDPHIYAFTTNTIPNYLKVGDTYRPVAVRLQEWREHFPNLQKEYEHIAKVSDDIYFRDFAVHSFLEDERHRSRLLPSDIAQGVYYSREFFKDASARDLAEAVDDIQRDYDENTGKYQFYSAETGLPETYTYERTETYPPRPNQDKTIRQFKAAVENGRTNLLMYAVMRFGKSFTSMCCATEIGANIVVVVSAKADVKEEWKKTVESHVRFSDYDFLTGNQLLENENAIRDKFDAGRKVVVFLTLQDLQGETIKDKHREIFGREIDLLIVDETHFGARAEKYGRVLRTAGKQHASDTDDFVESADAEEQIKFLDAKIRLHLSGTPYRILMGSEFSKEDIIAFYQFTDIVKDQEQWIQENNGKAETEQKEEWENPYYGFPQMIRFAFNPNESSRRRLKELRDSGVSFAFSALLKPRSIRKADDGSHKQFIFEQEILDLLSVIDGSKDDDELLGFLDYDKIKTGNMCRHIVCVLPYCASCDAMEALIRDHAEQFRNLGEYEIINISGVDQPNAYRSPSDKRLRLLYLFCDENKKEPTPMQEEVRANLSQKYLVVHEFSDIVSKAYDSVMQDVIAVYKKKEELFSAEKSEVEPTSATALNTEAYSLPATSFLKYPHVARVLTNSILPANPLKKEDEETSLERLLSEHLQTVVFQKPFNEAIIDSICNEVLEENNGEICEILQLRYQAQKCYYLTKYDECLVLLQQAVSSAIEKQSIPTWIANDIAIDIRHVQGRIDERNSTITLENPGQKLIDTSGEPVYFPYLDRQVENMQEEIAKKYYSQLNISPYTTNYGGLDQIFSPLANAFCIAEMHGSIVQTEITRDRLISIYSMLCTLYEDHDLLVEYINYLITNRDVKKLDAVIRTYNQSIDILNGQDIDAIVAHINNMPDPVHQMMSKFLLTSRLGYYMSDTAYSAVYSELIEYAMRWAQDDKRVYNTNTYIFDFFKQNTHRIDGKDIVAFICEVFHQGLKRFYMDCFKVLRSMDFEKLAQEDQSKIKQILLDVTSTENEQLFDQYYSSAVIRFCKSTEVPYEDLEAVIAEKYPSFYKHTFMLEMSAQRDQDFSEHIKSYLEEAKARSKTQGSNGTYSGYAYESLDVVYNIIKNGKVFPDTELLDSIVNVAIETLAAEKQTISAKLSAVRLLQLLYFSNCGQKKDWDVVSDQMAENISTFSVGSEMGFFSKDTDIVLSFQYNLFLSVFFESKRDLLVETLYSIGANDSYTIIQFLRIIVGFLDDARTQIGDDNLLTAFLYYSILMSKHKERDIKYHATKCLIELTCFKCTKHLALIHLSQIMNTGSQAEKIAILTRLRQIQADDDAYVKQIVNKGRSDNNYLVRFVAERENHEYD